ncbi:MAG: AtpZ/AtpI family protein [Candidatus Doudnabacteria bacterium]|nr:AtpZ/AtpI family protein [Candidatus Doudnabacteria bacterium]
MPDEKQKPPINRGELISIAFELGFIIALPVVIFGLGGKWLDAKMGTAPMFTLIGILTAIVSTSVWIYRKFKSYFKQ